MLCAMHLGLEIEQLWWDSDLQEVRVRASNGSFAGEATFYMARDGLARLARELEGFPRTLEDQRECTLAKLDGSPGCGGAHLRLRVLDRAGHCELTVELRGSHPECGRFPDQTVRLSMLVDPGSVDTFVNGLRASRPEAGETFRLPVSS